MAYIGGGKRNGKGWYSCCLQFVLTRPGQCRVYIRAPSKTWLGCTGGSNALRAPPISVPPSAPSPKPENSPPGPALAGPGPSPGPVTGQLPPLLMTGRSEGWLRDGLYRVRERTILRIILAEKTDKIQHGKRESRVVYWESPIPE